MMNKETAQLNSQDFFTNATQVAVTTIENVFNRHQCPLPNLNDLLYFCCMFLKLILSHLDVSNRDRISPHLREVLKIAADDGKRMCTVIMSSKIDTQEDRDKAVQSMITHLGGGGNVNSRLFFDVAKQAQLLGMINDGLWKLDNNVQYTAALEKDIESKLNELIDEKISEVYQMGIKQNDDPEPSELTFLVCAAINIGVMIGYASVLYHQSVDEMIDATIKGIAGMVQYRNR